MWRDLFFLLFPRTCAACGSPLVKNENTVCTGCEHSFPQLNYANLENNEIEKLFWGRTIILQAMSLWAFNKAGTIQNMIHTLKYNGASEVGLYAGKKIANEIANSNRFKNIDFIIPVPLHPKKLKIRGYNQSKFIADGISTNLNVPISEQLLVRSFHSESQTKKSRWQRWENMKDVFVAPQPAKLENKHVLLVDDVITTGATIEGCAKELNKIPNCSISIASVAYAGTL